MAHAAFLHAALLVLAALPALGATADVCLIQHPKPIFSRQARKAEATPEDSAEDGDEGEAEGQVEPASLKRAPHPNSHSHGRSGHGAASHPGSMLQSTERLAEVKHTAARPVAAQQQQHHHHWDHGHSSAAGAAAAEQARKMFEDSAPGQFLPVHSHPDSDAPLVGLLQAGEQFRVRRTRKSSSGEEWLELSDDRGFVDRAQAARVDADEEPAVGLLDVGHRAKRGATPSGYLAEGAPPVSQDTMANNFPKKVAPKHDVDHDALDMKKTKMSVKGLPKESSYQNHLTETADWGDEYPWSTEAPSPAGQSGAVRALPLVAVLAAGLALGGL